MIIPSVIVPVFEVFGDNNNVPKRLLPISPKSVYPFITQRKAIISFVVSSFQQLSLFPRVKTSQSSVTISGLFVVPAVGTPQK